MTYADYKPGETKAHTKEDVPVINQIAEYLKTHSVEALLRCVASGAIEAQRHTATHEEDCALGWLAWKANQVAGGEL